MTEPRGTRPGAASADSATVSPDWRAAVAVRGSSPDITVLHESQELKVVLVALEAGQALPAHPGPAASFHILAGTGSIVIDGVPHPVSEGATVIAGSGTQRAVRAASALVFLGNLGNPSAEHGLHEPGSRRSRPVAQLSVT